MFNIWKHVRLAGGVMVIIGAFSDTQVLIMLGLVVQYVGALCAIDRLERIIDDRTKPEDEDAIR